MSTHILKEGDWDDFINKQVLPVIAADAVDAGFAHTKGARVLALVGDLGAGKTTFSKHLLHTLGVKEYIQSPTFSIINSYDIDTEEFEKVFHIDVYRIEDPKELEVLKFAQLFDNPKHLVVIEWADTIKNLIPKEAIWITFEHDTMQTRKITIERPTTNKHIHHD